MLQDREFVATFIIGVIVLLAEITAPQGWKLGLRIAALSMFLGGFCFYLYGHIRAARLMERDKPIPILFAAGTPRRDAVRALNQIQRVIALRTGFDVFDKVERYFNVHYEDLISHRAEQLPPNPEIWHDFLEDSQEQARQFLQHVPGGRIYHIAVWGPAALAVGVGAMFGTRSRVVAYHYENDSYRVVLDLQSNIRRIKTALPPDAANQYINVVYPGHLVEDAVVVLDMAGHIAIGDVKEYVSRWQHPYSLVEVSNTYSGNLEEDDWSGVVQEIFQVFSALQRSQEVRRIHLFFSMPVPMALGIGMALGSFVPVIVYNWERSEGTYHPVLHLNQITSAL